MIKNDQNNDYNDDTENKNSSDDFGDGWNHDNSESKFVNKKMLF